MVLTQVGSRDSDIDEDKKMLRERCDLGYTVVSIDVYQRIVRGRNVFRRRERETGRKVRDDATEKTVEGTGENCETTDGRNTPMKRAKGEPWFRYGGRDGTWFVHFPERSARFLKARS